MRSERVYFHGVLGVAWCAKNAQTDNIMLHKVPQRLLLVSHDLRRRWLREWTISYLLHRSSSLLLLNCALLQGSDHHWLGPILRDTSRIDHLIRIVFAIATNDRGVSVIQIWFWGAANGVFCLLLRGEELLEVLISWPGEIYAAKKVKRLAEGRLLRDG